MSDSSIKSPATARPLKRSATAASLPTPPRTNRRRKNGKLRSLKAVEEDEHGTTASEEEDIGEVKYKRRRINNVVDKTEDVEAAFWMAGSSSGKSKARQSPTLDTDSDSDAETTTSFLSRRGQKSSTMGSAPVSPPPSRRRHATVAKIPPALKLLPVEEENPSPSGTSPPETPKSTRIARDSPENPFLASPLDLNDVSSTSKSPRTPKEFPTEKPTITYVFRGVKKTYPNPYYDHERNRARSPDPNSLLPPEHEDFTPDLRGAPRALWPKKKKVSPPLSSPESPSNRARRRKDARNAPNLADSDNELEDRDGDDDEVSLRPVKLFGPRRPQARAASRP
ncbi:hypothetical protein BDP27DRAFT_1423273 [Rhodocollybia butyracea]|uniref:Uncharacterized protein n=1 Tax=Rhodocollybia butyracea TaxID=206335 RepID=A0A9P5PPQ4_9AGAR|nr:hypothetical protein BDP27DRAFT_1423273 [Rhodocollybia butyracea]